MKKRFFAVSTFLIILASGLFAQTTQRLSFQSGLYHNDVTQSAELDGSASYEHQYAFSLGLGYEYIFNLNVSIKTAVHWQKNALQSVNISSGPAIHQDIDLETVNIPLLFSYTFSKYLFADAGPLLHFQTKNEPGNLIDKHSGIGLFLGVGFTYDFINFSLFAKPNLQLLNVIPFESSNYQERLFSKGFVFGLSYAF